MSLIIGSASHTNNRQTQNDCGGTRTRTRKALEASALTIELRSRLPVTSATGNWLIARERGYFGVQIFYLFYRCDIEGRDRSVLRRSSRLVQAHDAKINDRSGIDFDAVYTVKLYRLVPGFVSYEHRTVDGLAALSVLLLLPPPTVPTMEVVERLPIPLVKILQFEKQAVVAGMKTPTGLEMEVLVLIHDWFAFIRIGVGKPIPTMGNRHAWSVMKRPRSFGGTGTCGTVGDRRLVLARSQRQ